jgi:hypothetical protein
MTPLAKGRAALHGVRASADLTGVTRAVDLKAPAKLPLVGFGGHATLGTPVLVPLTNLLLDRFLAHLGVSARATSSY